MKSDLEGQTVLITGASGGIGAATARAFAAEGCTLLLHYHRNAKGAGELAAELDGNAKTVAADLAREEEVDALFAAAPPIDHLVVNAGIWEEKPAGLHEMTMAQWQETLSVNLTGAFLTCRGLLRQLAATPRERASIVLVASTAGLFGEEGHADYAASKAALAHGLTLSLKNEIVRLAPLGRVNCVCPGWVETPMAAAAMEEPGAVRRANATMALRKIAQPEDVAAAIVFLASHRLAGHLSGTILPVAGGMEGRLLHPPQ